MKKLIISGTPLTRQRLANPHIDKPYIERLKESNSIDLRDNHTIEALENGYIRILPIDDTKVYK